MKKRILLSLIATPLIIIGCGGGSSTTASTSASTFSKITGTVPGTLIEAFCADGSYAQVTSTQDGTAQHPFEISVPQNVECRLVMTTNENDPINRVITPIGFATATATGLTLSLNQDLNLGYVPLAMDPNTVPTVDNMVVDPLIVDITAATAMDTNMTTAMDTNMTTAMDTNMTTPMDPNMATVNTAIIPAFDTNGNGIIDAYEDMNGNGIMDAYDPDYTTPAGTYVDDDKGSSDDNDDDNKGSTDDDNNQTTGTTSIDDDDKGSSDNDNDDDDKGSNDNDNDDDNDDNDDDDDDKGSSNN